MTYFAWKDVERTAEEMGFRFIRSPHGEYYEVAIAFKDDEYPCFSRDYTPYGSGDAERISAFLRGVEFALRYVQAEGFNRKKADEKERVRQIKAHEKFEQDRVMRLLKTKEEKERKAIVKEQCNSTIGDRP